MSHSIVLCKHIAASCVGMLALPSSLRCLGAPPSCPWSPPPPAPCPWSLPQPENGGGKTTSKDELCVLPRSLFCFRIARRALRMAWPRAQLVAHSRLIQPTLTGRPTFASCLAPLCSWAPWLLAP